MMMRMMAVRNGARLGASRTRQFHQLQQVTGVLDRREKEEENSADFRTRYAVIQSRSFHMTTRKESSSFVVGAFSVGAVAYGGKLVADAISKRQEAAAQAKVEGEASEQGDGAKKEEGPSFFSWLNFALGKRFYEGGFEEEMTRREAALILGIRESASREKVREAHRRLALLNHPDTGGSTYVATKINEAKEKLLGGS